MTPPVAREQFIVVDENEIINNEIDESIRKWRIPSGFMTSDLRDKISESALSQTRTFFEEQGWVFFDDGDVQVSDDGSNPKVDYSDRLKTGVFYATKAIYEAVSSGISLGETVEDDDGIIDDDVEIEAQTNGKEDQE